MTLAAFQEQLRNAAPDDLVLEFLGRASLHALPLASDYSDFRSQVRAQFASSEEIYVVGSGNWGFSLNPKKLWSPFSSTSDIDTAIVSEKLYIETWNELREAHRSGWHSMSNFDRMSVRRNGENVYCGFASPLWIPQQRHPLRYGFKSAANKLSTALVGHRSVTMMFFRNITELMDYYKRGFSAAKRQLP